ncbi:MAG: hypothetical protein VYA30_10210 [Myxococcota bacterium]|nr:hypothetical protein [Myxococcota bacterium]
MSKFIKFSLSLGVSLALGSGAALALDNDPALYRLCVGVQVAPEAPCGSRPQADTEAFKLLTKEYALALSPTLMAPAETMGINGFQFNVQFATTTINADRGYWTTGIEDENPPSTLVATRIGIRKGLPGSIEIGMDTSYLFFSELWMFGVMAKWAPHEGMDSVPIDFALRGSFNRLIGSSELVMSTAGLDVVLSKSFGLAGVVNLAPYVAYSPLWVFSRSNVIDSTPGTREVNGEGDFVFTEQEQRVDRLTMGSRFITGAFNFTPEVTLSSAQQTYGVNLGADF